MDCGVKPRWPITGIPAERILLIDSIISSPPSILMACAPDSFILGKFPLFLPTKKQLNII
jgi:hypothetical protein